MYCSSLSSMFSNGIVLFGVFGLLVRLRDSSVACLLGGRGTDGLDCGGLPSVRDELLLFDVGSDRIGLDLST